MDVETPKEDFRQFELVFPTTVLDTLIEWEEERTSQGKRSLQKAKKQKKFSYKPLIFAPVFNGENTYKKKYACIMNSLKGIIIYWKPVDIRRSSQIISGL